MKLPEIECPPFFQFYAEYVKDDYKEELKTQLTEFVKFIQGIPESKHLFKYKEDKWTIKEVVGHCTDTERIKMTAAFRIARNDKVAIPGFEEDDYVKATNFNSRTMEDLLNDFTIVRKSSIALLDSLTEEELNRIGTASNKQISARALFYFLVGHVAHHKKILIERYLDLV